MWKKLGFALLLVFCVGIGFLLNDFFFQKEFPLSSANIFNNSGEWIQYYGDDSINFEFKNGTLYWSPWGSEEDEDESEQWQYQQTPKGTLKVNKGKGRYSEFIAIDAKASDGKTVYQVIELNYVDKEKQKEFVSIELLDNVYKVSDKD